MINLPSRIPSLLFFILFGLHTICAQNIDWAFHAPGLTGQPIIPTVHNTITLDHSGNIYMTSSVIDPTQFGPFVIHGTEVIPGIYVAASYLAKFNATGDVLWVKTFETQGGQLIINDITIDADNNLIIVGHASGTVFIDPISITTNYIAGEMFLAKFNSEGEVLWARISDSQPGFSSAAGTTVDVAPSGNIIIGGIMDFHVFFGTVEIIAGYNLFMASYDGNGTINWARPYGTVNPLSIMSEVEVDDDDNIYWVGSTSAGSSSDFSVFDTISFEPYAGSMFISKYDSDGDIFWLNHYGEDSLSLPNINAFNLALVEDGAIITGDFTEIIDLDGIILTEPTPFGTHLFIAKFEKTGRVDWAKQSYGMADGVEMFDISVNSKDEAFVCGRVSSSTGVSAFTLGEDVHMQSMTVDGLDNGFLAKYKADGDLDWMIGNSGLGISDVRAAVATSDNTAMTNGIFTDIVHISDTTFTAAPDLSSWNFYMAAFNGNMTTSISNQPVSQNYVKVYPNPAVDLINIHTAQEEEIFSYKLIGIRGEIIKEINNPKTIETFVTGDLHRGVYLILASGKKGIEGEKVILK